MRQTDFDLSDTERCALNTLIAQQAAAHAAEGEQPDGLSVVFHFTPVGREVEVSYAGGPWVSISS